VPESIRLEYKRDLYGNNDNSKKELLKDISAFANSQGGHLILGIDEHNGVADELYGTSCENPDDEILRMEQVIRSGIEPNIADIRIRAVALQGSSQSNQYCFVISIPQSQYPPHRVIANHHHRFYVRNSAGVHEPDVEELRRLFGLQKETLAESDRANTQTPIHALNLYGFLLNLSGTVVSLLTGGMAQQSPALVLFILACACHLSHIILVNIQSKGFCLGKSTCHIQTGISIMIWLGFMLFIIACLLYQAPSTAF